jgi:Transposase DDE domain
LVSKPTLVCGHLLLKSPTDNSHQAFKAREEDGTWEKVWRGLLTLWDEREDLDWDKAFLDGSFIPAKKWDVRLGSYERRARKLPKLGRPVKAGPGYAERWKVERTFAWLGNFRRLLVRHERYLSAFRAFFLVAFILMSLRSLFE